MFIHKGTSVLYDLWIIGPTPDWNFLNRKLRNVKCNQPWWAILFSAKSSKLHTFLVIFLKFSLKFFFYIDSASASSMLVVKTSIRSLFFLPSRYNKLVSCWELIALSNSFGTALCDHSLDLNYILFIFWRVSSVHNIG